MEELRYDLHMHSLFSDGTYTPKELIDEAVASGLAGISITDHDSVKAYEEGKAYAHTIGMTFLPGIEISSEWKQQSVHVLGYCYHPSRTELKEACHLHHLRREERNRKMVDMLCLRGFQISYDEVLEEFPSADTYGRPHLAKLLMQKGYVGSIQEAFQKYLGDGRPCYIPGQKWTTLEAIQLIQQAGGFAILAHPHLLPGMQLLRELIKLPFDGLEAYYGRFLEKENAQYVEMAQKHHLLITGGSDFHGATKPKSQIGTSYTPEKTIEIFLARMKEQS